MTRKYKQDPPVEPTQETWDAMRRKRDAMPKVQRAEPQPNAILFGDSSPAKRSRKAVARNMEAEHELVGIVLAHPAAHSELRTLDPQVFTVPLLSAVFTVSRKGFLAGQPVSNATIVDEVQRLGRFTEVETEAAIVKCAKGVASPELAKPLADILIERYERRRLEIAIDDLKQAAQNEQVTTQELKDQLDGTTARMRPSVAAVEIVSAKVLCETFPHLNEVLIVNLMRIGEVCNVIAASKTGKSWLTLHLALCVACGMPFLGTYPVRRGKVLICDNELHPSVLASRIKTVAEAMSLCAENYADKLQILYLRGRLMDVHHIGKILERETPGEYSLIVIDAFYRALPKDTSENDNAQIAAVYNTIDALAARMKAAIVLIHHSSKGSQSQKRVTDVGSGAGSISRAADCHLTIRDLEEKNAMVLEAALRSFPELKPIGLRFQFPLWLVDKKLDTSALKGNKSPGEEKQAAMNQEVDDLIIKFCDIWRSRAELRKLTGCGEDRINASIRRLLEAGKLQMEKHDRPRNKDVECFRRTLHAA